MTKWFSRTRLFLRANEYSVYTLLCFGLVYAMVLWPYGHSLIGVLFAANWLFVSRKRFSLRSPASRLLILLAAVYGLSLAGLFISHNKTLAWHRLAQQVPLLLFPLAFATTRVLDARLRDRILTQYVFTVLAAAIVTGIWGAVLSLSHRTFLVSDFVPIEGYPYISGLHALLALGILADRSASGRLRNSGAWAVAALVLAAYVCVLNVRLLTLCLAALAVVWLFRVVKSWKIRIAVAGMLGMALAAAMVASPAGSREKWTELAGFSRGESIPLDQDASLGRAWGGTALRAAIWRCALPLAERHPALGVGTGDVQDSLQQAYEDRRFYFASRYNRYNCHNQFLQMLVTNGIPGLLIFLAALLVPAIACTRGRNPYGIFLFLFAAICLTEVPLDVNAGIVWYSFFNSIFAFGRPRLQPDLHGE